MNTAFIKSLSFEELGQLAKLVDDELYRKNPETIASLEREKKLRAEWAAKAAQKNAINEHMRNELKKILVPGMRLKMKGCKDGLGLREFIRWDDGYLVCWQIIRTRGWVKTGMGDDGYYDSFETKTNQVTTHMPDKVSMVYTPTGDIPASQLRP